MKEPIIIRQATIDDEESVKNFFSVAFPHPQFKYPHRWNWLYRDNPFLNGTNSLPVWVALNDKEIVGMSCLMPQVFSVKGNVVKMSWCHDFRVLPVCRGMGVGTKLEKARQEAGDVLSLASSNSSVYIKKKLSYSSRAVNVVYLHVRRLDGKSLFSDLARYLKFADNASLFNLCCSFRLPALLSVFLSIFFRIRQRSASGSDTFKARINFERIDRFPIEADDLWKQIERRYALAVRRHSEYLNWKFVDQPHTSYQRYLVHDEAGLCGVLVFRRGLHPELPIGIISEFYTNRDAKVLRQMVEFAVDELYSQHCIMIRCSSSTLERTEVLSSLGFFPIHKNLSTFSFRSDNAAVLTKIALGGDWLMGLGDQDRDEYPETSHPSLQDLLQAALGRIPGEDFIKNFQ